MGQFVNLYQGGFVPESLPIIVPDDDDDRSLTMAQRVAKMSPEVQQIYADYMEVFQDEAAPNYEANLSRLRHAFRNAVDKWKLQEYANKKKGQDAP